jgi:hypothetical protein
MNNAVTNQPVAPRPRRTSRLLIGVLLLAIVAAVFAVQNHRPILDWVSLRNYAAPKAIAALATDDTMTPAATRMFYVNHPSVDSKVVFSGHCNFGREQSIVLGCYHGNQQGIYILDVTDARLNGVEQVTAAHEMLHAAYDRLSGKERAHIDSLLQNFYTDHVTDSRVRATIDLYRRTEPNDVINEMHSIFGTEISELTPELETYYSRYFVSRIKVVNYAAAYSAEFTSRQEQVARYDAQLKEIKAGIDANSTALSEEQSNLLVMRRQLDAERMSDPAQYNRDVDSYNARVAAFNSRITITRNLISQYNDLVGKRNAIAVEEQQLARAISGDDVPAAQ